MSKFSVWSLNIEALQASNGTALLPRWLRVMALCPFPWWNPGQSLSMWFNDEYEGIFHLYWPGWYPTKDSCFNAAYSTVNLNQFESLEIECFSKDQYNMRRYILSLYKYFYMEQFNIDFRSCEHHMLNSPKIVVEMNVHLLNTSIRKIVLIFLISMHPHSEGLLLLACDLLWIYWI